MPIDYGRAATRGSELMSVFFNVLRFRRRLLIWVSMGLKLLITLAPAALSSNLRPSPSKMRMPRLLSKREAVRLTFATLIPSAAAARVID